MRRGQIPSRRTKAATISKRMVARIRSLTTILITNLIIKIMGRSVPFKMISNCSPWAKRPHLSRIIIRIIIQRMVVRTGAAATTLAQTCKLPDSRLKNLINSSLLTNKVIRMKWRFQGNCWDLSMTLVRIWRTWRLTSILLRSMEKITKMEEKGLSLCDQES